MSVNDRADMLACVETLLTIHNLPIQLEAIVSAKAEATEKLGVLTSKLFQRPGQVSTTAPMVKEREAMKNLHHELCKADNADPGRLRKLGEELCKLRRGN